MRIEVESKESRRGREAYIKRVPYNEAYQRSEAAAPGALKGAKVQKIFDGKLYNGRVVEYSHKTGWYKAVYDDGDSEDLEPEEVLKLLKRR